MTSSAISAKFLTQEELTQFITKQKQEKEELKAQILKPENYFYKGDPLNLGICLDMEDIKNHPENTFFEVDDKSIIILDRFRRTWNTWIRSVNPMSEWKIDNYELLEILPTLSVIERGNLHNQLASKLYAYETKFCHFWTKFISSIQMLLYLESTEQACRLMSDVDVRRLYQDNCFYLINIDLDK